jgi:hypothetical protein
MTGNRRTMIALAIAAGLAVGSGSHAATVVLPRPGQVGFGMLGQFGTLLKSGDIGDDFGSGGGFAVRMRYRMRYERAVGLTFERHGFDVRVQQPPDSTFAPKSAAILATGAEIYQMFGTRTRNVRMLSAGIGLAQITQKLNDGETQLSGKGVGDGIFLSGGGEIEYFFWQSWAVDLSTRYHAVFLDGVVNHDVQLSAGLVFYASY